MTRRDSNVDRIVERFMPLKTYREEIGEMNNTCPICTRVWIPTVADDTMMPFCGHYDHYQPGQRPCEECALVHLRDCNPSITWLSKEEKA
jgi:hypothetical protein